jgi:glycosyltransferase involved in cell wall biosynthesis
VVLIEAMAARTPIVASALDGYMNVATDSRDAILVAPGDVDALEAGLRKVLDDRALATRLVEAGRRRAVEFSMSAVADRYEEIYFEVLDRHVLDAPRPTTAGWRRWWRILVRLRALASNTLRRMLVK